MELNKEDVKNTVDILMTEHYAEFFKALIGAELNIEDKEILDDIYNEYMNDDFELLSFELIEYAQDLKDEKHKQDEEFTL